MVFILFHTPLKLINERKKTSLDQFGALSFLFFGFSNLFSYVETSNIIVAFPYWWFFAY
jgi:hypothetical protein